MPQDPFKIDQLQIEPAAAGVRKIRRNSDGSMEFFDPSYVGGVKLSALVTAGTAALTAATKTGTASFDSESTKAVVFDSDYMDSNYSVFVEFDDNPLGPWWITAKTASGFTVNLADSVSLNMRWATIGVL